MPLYRLMLSVVSLFFIVVLPANASASSFLDKNEEGLFKAALASFQNLRTSHPQLKSLDKDKPTCFISYAWGVAEQEQWVHTLNQHLRDAGINTFLDIRDNPGGTNTIAFVERITKPETDFVILCGSKKLMVKLHPNNNEPSVVRLEVDMIGQRATWSTNKKGIIPLLLDGKHDEVLPSFLSTTVSINFQKREDYCLNCFSLLKQLYKLEHGDLLVELIIKEFITRKSYPINQLPSTPPVLIENKRANLTPKQRLEQKANQGDIQAQYELGLIYKEGKDIRKQPKRAVEWFEKAANQGHIEAQLTLSQMYLEGKDVKQDYEKALEWVDKLVEVGNAEGQKWLGDIYINGWGEDKNELEALKWYQKAAIQGHQAARSALGWNVSKEKLEKDDIVEALRKVEAKALSLPAFAALVNSDPTLTKLDLSGSKVGDEGAKALAQNTTLTELSLAHNQVGDEGAKAFAQNTTLRWLSLYGNKVRDEGARAFTQNTTLRLLSLSWNQVGDEGAKTLAQNTTLITLGLYGNKVGDEGVKTFAQNTSLTYLNLGHNQVKDEGTKALAQNTTLTTLYLTSNQVGDEGAKAFVQNTTLAYLNLEHNQVKDEGTKALRERQQRNPSLKIDW